MKGSKAKAALQNAVSTSANWVLRYQINEGEKKEGNHGGIFQAEQITLEISKRQTFPCFVCEKKKQC